jgi:hypothetical protein
MYIMLIVSKVLVGRKHEGGAWQATRRNKDTHVLVLYGSPELTALIGSLGATAGQLDLDITPCIPVLREWLRCSMVEKEAWEKSGSANAPIFDEAAWTDRADKGKSAEVRVYDNSVDMVLALIGTVRSTQNKEIEVGEGQAKL